MPIIFSIVLVRVAHRKCLSRYVVVGLCHKAFNLDNLPGCSAHSCGYHGDNGGLYMDEGFSRSYEGFYSERNEPFGDEDVISCRYDPETSTVVFGKNGTRQGKPVTTSGQIGSAANGGWKCL